MRTRDPRKEKALREKALAMIVRDGFDGLSMQKLAKAARVSPATIYIYWKDRDDLIFQLYREAFQRMAAHTLKDFSPDMPFKDGLRLQWLNRARYSLEYPDDAHFMEQVKYSPLHDKAQAAVDKDFMETMRAFVRGAIARGELVRMPVEVYWSVAFAPLYQLLKFHKHGKGMPGTGKFVLDEKTMMMTLDLVLKALKPD